MSFSGYHAKIDANIKMIRQRMDEHGPVGLLHHIFVSKLRYAWCNSCLGGDYYGTKRPIRETWLWNLWSQKGSHFWITQIYTHPYYLLLLFGILFSGVSALCWKRGLFQLGFIGRLSLLGLFLFMSLWECNSRYLLCFVPVLILVAAEKIVLKILG